MPDAPNDPRPRQPDRRNPAQSGPAPGPAQPAADETDPAQEYGERVSTGKAIDRGGREGGRVPGADQ